MLPGLSERKVVVMGTRRQQVPEAGISTVRVCAIMMQRSVSHDWGGVESSVWRQPWNGLDRATVETTVIAAALQTRLEQGSALS